MRQIINNVWRGAVENLVINVLFFWFCRLMRLTNLDYIFMRRDPVYMSRTIGPQAVDYFTS